MTDDFGTLTLSYTEFVGNPIVLSFGTMTKLSHPYSKSVLLTPILTKGVANTFAIETNSSMTITINFARTKEDEDRTGMTNAEWDAHLLAAVDRWQARTNGFTLKYVPGTVINGVNQNDNPYVSGFEYNGFVKSVTTNYEKGMTEYISGSLVFEVGTMMVKS